MSGTHDFRVLDTELLTESPILAVRRDTLAMPGDTTATREVVEHFGAVAVVALNHDDEIAMVHQYRHSVAGRLLELPAGLLDLRGEDELRCAERELHEEAGLAATDWSVLVDMVTSPGFCEEAVRVFLARDLRELDQPEAEFEEADMVAEWVPIEEATSAIFSGEIVNSIAIAGIFAANEVLAGRQTPRPVSAPFEYRPQGLARRRQFVGEGQDMKKMGD